MENFSSKGFEPGTGKNDIHAESSVQNFREYMDTDVETVQTLVNGYSVPNKHLLGMYEEQNNKSCIENMDIVRDQVQKWLAKGVVQKVHDKPTIVNPLSVVTKTDYTTDKIKHRVVIDMSRHVNEKMPKYHFIPDSLQYFDPLIEKDMYMTSFDIEAIYHHEKLYLLKYFVCK